MVARLVRATRHGRAAVTDTRGFRERARDEWERKIWGGDLSEIMYGHMPYDVYCASVREDSSVTVERALRHVTPTVMGTDDDGQVMLGMITPPPSIHTGWRELSSFNQMDDSGFTRKDTPGSQEEDE
jgi:hypothetical protein